MDFAAEALKMAGALVVVLILMGGAMINKVRKSARPTTTWLGGECIVPIACLNNAKTMTTRVKEVTIMINAGASVRAVRRKRMRIPIVQDSGPFGPVRSRLSFGSCAL